MATDPTTPHAYVRHADKKPGCAVCGNLRKDPIHDALSRVQPRQLTGGARLMELTPELVEHYS